MLHAQLARANANQSFVCSTMVNTAEHYCTQVSEAAIYIVGSILSDIPIKYVLIIFMALTLRL